MGKVFGPEDAVKGRRRLVEEAVKDLNPEIREATVRILESRLGRESEEKLGRLLGKKEAKRLIKRIKGI